MELWEQAIGFDVEISATEVAKCAKQREESGHPDFNSALWMTVGKNGKNLPMALGRWLASKCGVVIGGRRFVAGGRSGHPTYRLETTGEEIVEMSEGDYSHEILAALKALDEAA